MKPGLPVVYLTVFIDLVGFGIILPALPYYAEAFGATGVWIGAILAAYSAAQLVGASLLGRLSDRVGRRPILLMSLAGSAASLLLCGLAGSLWLLLAARALAGLFGGSIAAAQAYIADVTAPERAGEVHGPPRRLDRPRLRVRPRPRRRPLALRLRGGRVHRGRARRR